MNELSGYAFSPLREGDIALYRGSRNGLSPVLLVAAEEISLGCVERLKHEYELKCELDADWAARPVALTRYNGRVALVLEDPGGVPIDRLLGRPLDVSHFLRIAIPLAAALRRLHERGLIHKDIKPANILADPASGGVWLTGFGIASRLPREHQAPAPPEVIAGTLAYMAPEQTGRMNRSVDSRSDLYALGVTFYEMLTGQLPFIAADPMEWVHCHIARQPAPPHERVADVPEPLSAIVMKLLAKTAEERYQTASSLEADLRRCFGEWRSQGRIEQFQLGTNDVSDRLLIPEKLYGREHEIETLVAAFDRVVAQGNTELVLVSGYSGIGKSSVVHELHKVLVPQRGLFASGKFGQYKRDIPYATVGQAFQTLVRSLLSQSDLELGRWRDSLNEALGPNGQLIVNLVPELELVIGKQSPVAELPPQDAKNRFQMVFRRFLGVFARPEHPLALFLDDLQWLDAATLELLEQLIIDPDVRHVLLVGAYRNNEVSLSHPLMRTLEAIRKAGARMQEIVLAPLELDDVGRLVVDSLRCNPDSAHPLAQLVHEKTGGNPFFAIQFLTGLAEEGLLAFDADATTWISDLARIRAKGYTDNVVDFMAAKLKRLSDTTQQALKQLACLGNVAEIATLTLVLGVSEKGIHAALWEAASTGLILRLDGSYAFLHDRVQEAAYALIPEDERAAAHLQIGRVLASQTPSEELEEKIFEIVNQLDRGATLIHSREERDRVAELNLIAGKRAKTSTAYASALSYLVAGYALLTKDSWEQQYELIFSIEYHRAECELLTADLAAAEERLTMLSHRARNLVDVAAVACLRLTLYTTLDRSDRGVEVCLEYLQRGDVHWSPHPTKDEVRHEYDRIWRQIGSRSIEQLVHLPLVSNPEVRATLDVLTEVVTPALFTDENLLSLVICRMVNLSLEHGNSDGSCFAYVWLGMILGPHFGDYRAGFRFGRLGYDLVEKRGLHRYQARAYMSFGNLVMPWTRHIQTGRDLVRRAFAAANKIGDLTFAAYSCNNLNTNLIATGDPLADAQREAENGLDFAGKARFGLVIDIITTQLGLIRTLRGLTAEFGSFNEERFNESQFEDHLQNDPRLALPECWYWVRKLQARVYANDYASAIEAASKAQQLLWTSPSFFEVAEFHFYGALARASQCDAASAGERARHLEALAAHHKQLEVWAENCSENFGNRAALVGAEIARLEGREFDAERLYEQAIRSARANGFIHNEALANELASRYYAARGLERFAQLRLRNARDGYLRWGADGKVRQLELLHPHLRDAQVRASRTATIGAPVERLDVGTVLKAVQATSGEIVVDELIKTLLRIAVEHAGAGRGLLILLQGDEPRIAAEATTGRGQVEVALRQTAVSPAELPESLLHTVIRTRESVILDDALAQNPFSSDEYICHKHARSVLCLPLVKQSKLIGVLYLENNLTSYVFTPARVSVLELLASQAAISLENARLYNDLREREARIRRLVDSNIIGIVIWDFEGRFLEANDEFLRMVGYDRDDLLAGSIRWTDLTPPDWRDRNNARIEQQKNSGRFEPFEKEYTRKDGSRVPVLIGGATFEIGGDQGVAYVLDLTQRERAEENSRESELKLRQIIETVPGLIWSTGPDGEPTHFNQRILDYSGMPSEEFMHGGWEAFVHPADYPKTSEAFYHAIQTGISYQSVMRLRREDGEFRWHDARCEPLCDRQGRIIQWYGLCVDIDERKKAEDQLRRSEAYLAEAERLNHSGGWAVNRKGGERKIVYWSEESYRIFGLDPLQGMPTRAWFWQQVHPDDRSGLREETERALREKRDFVIAFRILLPDGTIKYLEANGHHLFSAGGELLEIMGTFVDVTERKRANDALRESEAKFRDFAETASDWFWEIGPDYKFTLLSEKAFGSGAADRIGTTSWDHALDLETEPDKWRLVQATLDAHESFRDFVYCTVDGNGAPMYVKSSGKPVFDANGEFRGYRGTGTDVTAIMRAHEALRESERSWRSAIDGIAGLVSIHFPNGEVETVNRQCLEYFGRSLEELKNWGTSDAVHPEDLPYVLELFKRAMASGNPFQIDQRLRRFDGEYRWFNNRGVPIRDDSGRITRWYVLITDIEDRKRAEEALRSALDGIAGLIVVLAPNGEAQTVNRQSLEYFGRSLEELKNWGTSDAVHPDDLPRTLEVFKRGLASGNPFQNELRLRRSDGEYRWFDTRHVPIRDDSGHIARWYVLATDIEDRKRAEHASRSAIDAIAGLVMILAPNGEVEAVNRQVFEYFGRSLEEITNWATNDALHPEDLPRVVEIFSRAVTSGIPFNFDHRLRRFDGKYLWFDTRGLPIRDDSGRIARWYVLLTDIEDRTRALARLEQMRSDFAHVNRVSMMGELAASLSHEITQPIGSARNNARAAQNFLDMQPPDFSEVWQALSRIVRDTDRAGDIIDRIRDHIKKTPPRKEHFDLNEAINEVIVLGRSTIIKNGVSVQTRLSEGLFPIHCDRVQLQQVVLNLILNAAEAMGSVEAEPRDLLISTEQHRTGVLVAVRDSGPGIDPAHLDNIFEAFYTTKSRGVGMGLSICRSIIDAHGGRLWAEVNEPRGTTFQFTLPAVQVGS